MTDRKDNFEGNEKPKKKENAKLAKLRKDVADELTRLRKEINRRVPEEKRDAVRGMFRKYYAKDNSEFGKTLERLREFDRKLGIMHPDISPEVQTEKESAKRHFNATLEKVNASLIKHEVRLKTADLSSEDKQEIQEAAAELRKAIRRFPGEYEEKVALALQGLDRISSPEQSPTAASPTESEEKKISTKKGFQKIPRAFEAKEYAANKKFYDPLDAYIEKYLGIASKNNGLVYRVIRDIDEEKGKAPELVHDYFYNFHDYLTWLHTSAKDIERVKRYMKKHAMNESNLVNIRLAQELQEKLARPINEDESNLRSLIDVIKENPEKLTDFYAQRVLEGSIEKLPEQELSDAEVEQLLSEIGPQEIKNESGPAALVEESIAEPIPVSATPSAPLAPAAPERLALDHKPATAVASYETQNVPADETQERHLGNLIAGARTFGELYLALRSGRERQEFITLAAVPRDAEELIVKIQELENRMAMGEDISEEVLAEIPQGEQGEELRNKVVELLSALRADQMRPQERIAEQAIPVEVISATTERIVPKTQPTGWRGLLRKLNPFAKEEPIALNLNAREEISKEPTEAESTPLSKPTARRAERFVDSHNLDAARASYAKTYADFEKLAPSFRRRNVDLKAAQEMLRVEYRHAEERGEELTVEELYARLVPHGVLGKLPADDPLFETMLESVEARLGYEQVRQNVAERMYGDRSQELTKEFENRLSKNIGEFSDTEIAELQEQLSHYRASTIFEKVILEERELLDQAKIAGFPPAERTRLTSMKESVGAWWGSLTPNQRRLIMVSASSLAFVGAGYAGSALGMSKLLWMTLPGKLGPIAAAKLGGIKLGNSFIAGGVAQILNKPLDTVVKKIGFNPAALEAEQREETATEFASAELSLDDLHLLEQSYEKRLKVLAKSKARYRRAKIFAGMMTGFGTGIGLGVGETLIHHGYNSLVDSLGHAHATSSVDVAHINGPRPHPMPAPAPEARTGQFTGSHVSASIRRPEVPDPRIAEQWRADIESKPFDASRPSIEESNTRVAEQWRADIAGKPFEAPAAHAEQSANTAATETSASEALGKLPERHVVINPDSVPDTEINIDHATVHQNEGLWHAVRRQFHDRLPNASNKELDAQTGKILAKYGYIKENGINTHVGHPGVKVFLGTDNKTLRIEGDSLSEYDPQKVATAQSETKILEPNAAAVSESNPTESPVGPTMQDLKAGKGNFDLRNTPEGRPFVATPNAQSVRPEPIVVDGVRFPNKPIAEIPPATAAHAPEPTEPTSAENIDYTYRPESEAPGTTHAHEPLLPTDAELNQHAVTKNSEGGLLDESRVREDENGPMIPEHPVSEAPVPAETIHTPEIPLSTHPVVDDSLHLFEDPNFNKPKPPLQGLEKIGVPKSGPDALREALHRYNNQAFEQGVDIGSQRVIDLAHHLGFEDHTGQMIFEEFPIHQLMEKVPSVSVGISMEGTRDGIINIGSAGGTAFRLPVTKDLAVFLEAVRETTQAHNITGQELETITLTQLFRNYGQEIMTSYDTIKELY